jgi:hypothetical protein
MPVERGAQSTDFASEARTMIKIVVSKSDPVGKGAAASRPAILLDRFYYFILAVIIAAVVVKGFGPTLNERLLHPLTPVPFILYFHAAVFTSWVILFMLQTALIGTRRVKLHRKVGVLGFVLGVTLAITGVATVIVMARFRTQPHPFGTPSLAIALNDMAEYSIFFGLAIYWRKKPEFHRRLMFIATCTLTSAAFVRLMPPDSPVEWMYVGVDVLILLGLGRDWIVNKRVHPAYLYGLPAALLGQSLALYLYLSRSPAWLVIAHWLIG